MNTVIINMYYNVIKENRYKYVYADCTKRDKHIYFIVKQRYMYKNRYCQ